MIAKLLGFNLLIICFFHGVFASGFMPILSEVLGEESGLAFSLYFVGIFLGQIFIFVFTRLSKNKLLYPCYEMAFSICLIIMAMNLTPIGLQLGRFAEGIFAGMALPMLFSLLSQLKGFLNIAKRIAAFNTVFSLGFIAGTPFVEKTLNYISVSETLSLFGIFLFVFSFSLFFLNLPNSENNIIPKLKEILEIENFKNKFLGLFISKTYYGFILGFITSYSILFAPSYEMTELVLIIVASFIVAQVISILIQRFYPKEHILNLGPIFISISLFFMLQKESFILFLVIASIIHGCLLFVSLKNLGEMPSGAKGFALYNAITDLGMILGSALSIHFEVGIYVFILVSIVPFSLFLIKNPSQVRGEKYYPFVGPFIMFKVFKRQLAPNENNTDCSLDKVTFENKQITTNPKIFSFLFVGDLCPTRISYSLSNEVKSLFEKHDQVFVNLEGTQTDKNYTKDNDRLSFDISDSQLSILLEGTKNIIFSLINNHIFDRGIDKLNETLSKLERQSQRYITSKGLIFKNRDFNISTLAISYGVNLPWRNHTEAFFIKPEELQDLSHSKTIRLQKMIKELKLNSDFLILSYHWGYECEYIPSQVQQKCGEILKEMGVDLLYGHHCHIAQGFSLEEDFCLLYSLGNFVSNMKLPIYQQGVLYSVDFSIDKNRLKVSNVTPYFTELNPIDKEVMLISREDSLAFKNFKKIANQSLPL